jgi:MFS family permease
VNPNPQQQGAPALGPVLGAAMEATAHADLATAFDTFMTAVCGPGYRPVLERVLGAEGMVRAEQDAGLDIGRAFGSGLDGLQWTVDSYTLVFAALMLTGGTLGDRFGHNGAFLGGLLLVTVASAAAERPGASGSWSAAGRSRVWAARS